MKNIAVLIRNSDLRWSISKIAIGLNEHTAE